MENNQLPSSSPIHGPYFGICFEDLLGLAYRLTDPTDARMTSLEKKNEATFNGDKKKEHIMVKSVQDPLHKFFP